MEIDVDGNIPFLDVLITKQEVGSGSHQIFRKRTHTKQYLHANSYHHSTQKFGVLNSLATRALRISDDLHMNDEKTHLLEVFMNIGDRKPQGLKAFQKAAKGPRAKVDPNNPITTVHIPFIQRTSNKLACILKKSIIFATFKPLNIIWSSLRFVKDPIDPFNTKEVYTIALLWEALYR